MIELNLEKLKAYLERLGYTPQIQEETQQLYLLFKMFNQEFPLFYRVYDEQHLLQILIFLPIGIKKGTEGDVARLLHLLNKEMDLPGFGMDEEANVVFYRVNVPAKDGKTEEVWIEAYTKAAQSVCEAFSPVIVTVAQGSLTFEEALRKAQSSGSAALPPDMREDMQNKPRRGG